MRASYRVLPVTVVFGAAIVLLSACGNDDSPTNSDLGDWLVPVNQVFQGAPKDGIAAISSPKFVQNSQISVMLSSDLIVGVKSGGEIRGYPHPILDWHEIVNDEFGGSAFALTYCPLTGTAIGWDRIVNGVKTTFGVSGFLYNTNLMPYDRATNSVWSQMRQECVNGQLIGDSAKSFQVIETTWNTWKQMFPNAPVMSTATGFNRPYGSFPYGSYREPNTGLIFPVDNTDTRLPNKDRVVGLEVGDQSKVYRILNFPDTIGVINDNFNNSNVVVVGSSTLNFGMAYSRTISDSVTLTFTPALNAFPAVMEDNEGTRWDLFGEGLSGPRAGQSLPRTNSYVAYWFAWVAFHENVIIDGQ